MHHVYMALALVCAISSAQAQNAWRCVVNGVPTYQDRPCAPAPAPERAALPSDTADPQSLVDQAIARAIASYPFLDAYSPTVDLAAIKAVDERRDIHIRAGHEAHIAIDMAVRDVAPSFAALRFQRPANTASSSGTSVVDSYDAYSRRLQAKTQREGEERQRAVAQRSFVPPSGEPRPQDVEEQQRRCNIEQTSLARQKNGNRGSGSECLKLRSMLKLPEPPVINKYYDPDQGRTITRFDQYGRPYTDFGNGAPIIDQTTGRSCLTDGGGNIISCN